MNLFDYICTINISIPQLFFMRILKAIFLVIFICAIQHCYCQKDESVRKAHGKIGSCACSLDSLNKKKELAKCDSLENAAATHCVNSTYSETIRSEQAVLKIMELILGKEHPDYATALGNLASNHYDVGNYSEAIRLGQEALQINESIWGKEHSNYATSLGNLANYYAQTGNYSEAIKLGQETLLIREKIHGKMHMDYVTTLSNLSTYYYYIGSYAEAIRMEQEALLIKEKYLANALPQCVTSLINLAIYYGKIGDYTEAIILGEQVLLTIEKTHGRVHPYYVTALSNLAGYYCDTGNYTEAIRLGKESMQINEKMLGSESPGYAMSLGNLANCYYKTSNYPEAFRLGKETMLIWEKILGKEHPRYAMSLSNLAFLYSNANNYSEAIRLGYEALLIFEKIHGKEHPDYTTALSCLALIYKSYGNLSKFRQLWYDYINIMLEQTKGYFSELPSYERNTYWKRIDHNFKVETPYFAFESNCIDFTDLCYNSVLISKGIILDTEKEFSKLIVDNKDNSLDSLVHEYRNIRMFLHKLYERPISERYVNTDSLEREASLLEHELISKSKAIGDYTHNLAIDWKQVRDSLGKRDVAVEFIKFPIPETDSVMYCALTLRQGYQKPKMIPLFEASELQRIHSHNYYTTTALSKLIWEPLDAEISGAENIYFASDGELYNIAIESLLHYDQKKQEDVRMCEKWNMYRLSSTREIAKRRSEKLPVKANQYGGLDYSADIASLEHQSKLYDNHAYTYERSVPDSLGVRGEFGPLTHTLSEAQYIDSLYKQHGIASKVYTGQDGSEPSFKHLSGQHITNLHIATHGFYWSESDMENSPKSFMRFLNAMDEGPRYREDKAMTRTGLCLSGANAIFSDDIPDNVDDGVITAREISTLNLNGLDLVVLSACQTALGELKGDGVYGLQRGFKQAGAETIIMSLWKVDDLATMILMKEFYKCYLSGDSKRDAFMKAQNKVRTFDEMVDGVRRNFSSPKYWAAFIMLDGLE